MAGRTSCRRAAEVVCRAMRLAMDVVDRAMLAMAARLGLLRRSAASRIELETTCERGLIGDHLSRATAIRSSRLTGTA